MGLYSRKKWLRIKYETNQYVICIHILSICILSNNSLYFHYIWHFKDEQIIN